MKALVTGASGFIGSHIALALAHEGHHVRCLMRSGKDPHKLANRGIEIFEGDLLDKVSLWHALNDRDTLFHAAALYTLWLPNPKEIYDINVEGTRNILIAARKKNISKIIYTSTVGTIGIPADGTHGNELTPIDISKIKGHYKISKYQAEQVVLKMASQGNPIVIVNPSAPMGPGDIKPTPTGQIILDFLLKKMPAYTDTGLNIIDVRDVAKGHILAAHKGRIGEKYILGNTNLSLKEILNMLSSMTGLPSPKIKIPQFILPSLASLNAAYAKIFKTTPRISPDAVKMASKYMYFDSSKAINELGLPQTPIKIVLKDAIDWFYENNTQLYNLKTC